MTGAGTRKTWAGLATGIAVLIGLTLLRGYDPPLLQYLRNAGFDQLQQAVQAVVEEMRIGVALKRVELRLKPATFQPLRKRIQRAVDRRFYRAKYDAAATIDRFADRLRDQVDLTALNAELLQTVRATVSPAHARVWIRPPTGSGG